MTAKERDELIQGEIKKRASKMFVECQQFLPPEKAKAAAIWCVHQLEVQYNKLFPTSFADEEEKNAAEVKYDYQIQMFDRLRKAIAAF